MNSKEPIIIDGVDVSRCKKLHWDIAPFLKKEKRPFNQNEWKCGGGFAQTYCHIDKNCLYKQFKRKEQECELLETQLESYHIGEAKLVQRNQELEQECEELKSQVDEDYNYYTTELKTLRDIISNKEKRNAALFLTSGHYRKALEEIEKYLKLPTNVCLTDCSEYSIGQSCSQNCFHNRLKLLLDIISKAKSEKNNAQTN